MAHDLLTDKQIRAATPRETPYKMGDGRGMSLIVMPTGAKVFRLKYRLHGAEKSFSCGSYPDTSLTAARTKRDEARALIAAGIDPVQAKREARATAIEARRQTFETAAEGFYRKNAAAWSETHQRDVRRIIDNELLPTLGLKAMHTIKAADCHAIIERITAREAFTFAKDVRMYGRAIWRDWNRCRATKLADPWADVDVAKGPDVKHHPAIPRSELGELMRRVRNGPATPLVRLGLLMLMHVAVRPGELRGATWGEFNVGERLWTIPGARMKKNLDHVVPLTDQSLDLLAQIRIACADLRGVPPQELRSDDLVLPHAFDFARPISDNTLNHAVWRAGYKSRHCAHGCRSVFSSWANEIGKFNPDAVERQLAHVTAGPVRKAYNRAEYLDERIRMMHAWSAYLEGQERTATIIPFPVAAAS